MKKITSHKGFTLIELLVVVAIIGILAATILASLGSARSKARNTRAQSELSSMRAAAELYYSSSATGYDIAMFQSVPSGMKNLVDSVDKVDNAFKSTPKYKASSTSWYAYASLGGTNPFCVDSNGFAGELAGAMPFGQGTSTDPYRCLQATQ